MNPDFMASGLLKPIVIGLRPQHQLTQRLKDFSGTGSLKDVSSYAKARPAMSYGLLRQLKQSLVVAQCPAGKKYVDIIRYVRENRGKIRETLGRGELQGVGAELDSDAH